jgi:mono/diheme cytochrome c family protein
MFATGIKASLGDPAAGARIFAANCARCHGTDGVGMADARHIDLGSAAWQASMRDAAIVATVRAGRGTAMPAFTFTEQELRDLLAHVRSLVRTGATRPGVETPTPDTKRGGY